MSDFQKLVYEELYAGLTLLKKRGRKPKQKTSIPLVYDDTDDDEKEVIKPHGTRTRPRKKQTVLLDQSFFSPQPAHFYMFPYYNKSGSVLLLDGITDLPLHELVNIFQIVFPDLMKCEITAALDACRTESISTILQKNIKLFSNPTFVKMDSEKKNIFAFSIAMLAHDLCTEHKQQTCVVCDKNFDRIIFQCEKKCASFICSSCIVDQISNNTNRCVGIGCVAKYDITVLPIIEQKRFHEKQYAKNVIMKRINENLFLCNCSDEFFTPNCFKKHELFVGFVKCPKCEKNLCVTCGLQHEEDGFCASSVNAALGGLTNADEYKPCPQCATMIQKDSGCLHMQCRQCNNQFCFSCGMLFEIFCFCFFLGFDYCDANECYNPHIKWSITMFYSYLKWRCLNNGLFVFWLNFFLFFIGCGLDDFIKCEGYKLP